ncbi:MAG: YihA family ribosome biogenesis GTP-binding protein [Rhodospirillales bacterium]|nr:YihA family ribosome biogenesis GTP-binding protein [Rhodospirillales bacterium]
MATTEDGGDDEGIHGAWIERGRHLFAQPCDFIAAAARLEQLPPSGLPEVAFAGRSNVGKSSLINALTGRRTLARISQTPGRTRQVNFFELGGAVILVDLPGYGYAAAAKEAIGSWSRLVDAYLAGRARLTRVMLLIDSRRGLKDLDRRVMALLDTAAVSYQAVLTKSDKATVSELSHIIETLAGIRAQHTALHPMTLSTSARTSVGLADVRAAVAALIDSDRSATAASQPPAPT